MKIIDADKLHYMRTSNITMGSGRQKMGTEGENGGYKYKAFINGEWHDLTLSDSPNELTEWLQSSEEWERVKHGHWIESDVGLMCSECNHYTETTYYEPFNNEFGRGWALKRPYYCGYCGAKMDEVTNETY